MNRLEFMARLEALLSDISPSEREEALHYYNEYFNDAGVENEEGVIESLGSPEDVAATICAGLAEGAENTGEFSEHGYRSYGQKHTVKNELLKAGAAADRSEPEGAFAGSQTGTQAGSQTTNAQPAAAARKEKKKWGAGTIILVVLLTICALPILVPLAIAALAVVIGVIVTVVALLFGLLVAAGGVCGALVLVGIILLVIGIILAGVGLIKIFAVPLGGLCIFSGGILMAGIGILMTVGFIWLLCKVVPALIRGIVWVCCLPFNGRRKAAA